MERNMRKWVQEMIGEQKKRALPVLSFPAVQLMGCTVRELIGSAQLQAEGMRRVAERVPSAAAVSLMDLSVEAEAFGAPVRVSDDEVPSVTGRIVEDEEQARALAVPPVGAGRTGLCVEAMRLASQAIGDRPVFSGVIGPFSLAGRLMDVTEILYACYDEPETVHIVLEKASAFLTQYLIAMREAGANGAVMAEPLAGLLNPQMGEEFSCRYVKQIVEAVQTDSFIVIYHNCGNAADKMLREIAATGCAGYHFGNAAQMRKVLEELPRDALVMGNIDPAGQLRNGTPQSVREAVRALREECGGYANFVLSSGCDIPPATPWENIDAFFEEAMR
ncbi:MAG TPA: uroporphyrinogen decarboxylase family protein [Candidatus Aphodomonas merdavium]|nr:uroporphyrinogen decarboxylase family protein [Candidatus Aphodomonas merdavium]